MRPFYDAALPLSAALRSLAFHEAGHAVLGLHYGLEANFVELHAVPELGPSAWSGCVDWPSQRCLEWRYAVISQAGEVANRQQLLSDGLPVEYVDAPHDRDLAETVCATTGYQIAWPEVNAATEALVEALWPKITEVADALLNAPDHRLTGTELNQLVFAHRPHRRGADMDGWARRLWRRCQAQRGRRRAVLSSPTTP